MTDDRPILWQLAISHYSEKARWALAYKKVAHRRRTCLPGMHIPMALWLTRGEHDVFPVLELDGRTIGDSTAVVAAIEERFPDPPLYPADPGQRRRALELEDFFDEELGPQLRQLLFYELLSEPKLFAEVSSQAVPGPLGQAEALIGAYARVYTSLRFAAGDAEAAIAGRAKIVAAMDRVDAELAAGGGDYLVGEGFSVADLTAASLFFLLIVPKEGPLRADQQLPASFESLRDELEDRPGYRWVEEMFRRHRNPVRPAAAASL